MTYEEIFNKVKEAYENADASNVEGHIAIEFDVCGEGAGAFYAEIKEGKLDLQPYNYYDHDAAVIVDSEVLLEIVKGEKSAESAYLEGKMRIDGNLSAVTTFTKVKVNKPVTAEEKVVVEEKNSMKEPEKEAVKESAAEEAAAKRKPVKKTRKAGIAKATKNVIKRK